MILSKLWHLLREIPVPKVWLDEIRSIVRRFVLPFWPAPSWESICLPKSKGGLGIIDLHTQHHALQIIYIQRILCGKKDTDFVTPWIGYCIYLYTGHHSFLPWLQYPAQFKAHFKQLPTMTVLTKVLTELPSLPHHPQCSGRWYTDIPLRCALLPRQTLNADINTESDISLGYAISAVPLQYLVSDMFQWSYFHQAFFDPVENGSIRSRTGKPAELYRLLQDRNPVIRWDPTIAKFMPSQRHDSGQDLANYWISIHAIGDVLARYVPSCAHWRLLLYGQVPIPLWQISSKQFRQFRQQQSSPSSHSNRVPYRIPTDFRPPIIWKTFWSLALPHKARTCWWRLLREKLYLRVTLHKWDARRWETPQCQFCIEGAEDAQHFFVSCPKKWPFIWNI